MMEASSLFSSLLVGTGAAAAPAAEAHSLCKPVCSGRTLTLPQSAERSCSPISTAVSITTSTWALALSLALSLTFALAFALSSSPAHP